MTRPEAEQDAQAASEPRDYDGKLHAQQVALRKLQRKYDTVKGDLRVANERAAVAERERDEAREALRPFVTRGVVPDAPPRPMTFEEGQFVVWMRHDEVEAARAVLAEGTKP